MCSPILKLDVDLAEPLITLLDTVHTMQGLLKYSLIFDATIPKIPSGICES